VKNNKYSNNTIKEAHKLRSLGKTYSEIRNNLSIIIPKSTLSIWCKNITLSSPQIERINKLNLANLAKARLTAATTNKIKRKKLLEEIETINTPISKTISSPKIAKIALAMLCLGEASKYNILTRSAFHLGSSDPRIITIFLALLKKCFNFELEKIRCTVQCRADQNIEVLEKFWMDITEVPKRLFYKAQIDPRTKGKPTKKKYYKGVLRIDYFDTKVQLELESLSHLIYNLLRKDGPVVYR
jgi:hypothetical protein